MPETTDATPYDPSAPGETIEKVAARLRASDDAERMRVLDLENYGQHRVGILEDESLWPSAEFVAAHNASQVGGPSEMPEPTRAIPEGLDPQAEPTMSLVDLEADYGKRDSAGYFPGFPVQVYPPLADPAE